MRPADHQAAARANTFLQGRDHRAQDDTPGAQDDTFESASFDAQLVFFEEM